MKTLQAQHMGEVSPAGFLTGRLHSFLGGDEKSCRTEVRSVFVGFIFTHLQQQSLQSSVSESAHPSMDLQSVDRHTGDLVTL